MQPENDRYRYNMHPSDIESGIRVIMAFNCPLNLRIQVEAKRHTA